MSHRVLSWYNVCQFPEVKAIFDSGNQSSIEDLLYNLGFDINKDIEKQYCYHRPLGTNQVFLTDRWIGEERKDSAWLNSKHCTQENNLEAIGIKDIHFQAELLNMCRQINYTGLIVENMKENSEESYIEFVEFEGEDVEQ